MQDCFFSFKMSNLGSEFSILDFSVTIIKKFRSCIDIVAAILFRLFVKIFCFSEFLWLHLLVLFQYVEFDSYVNFLCIKLGDIPGRYCKLEVSFLENFAPNYWDCYKLFFQLYDLIMSFVLASELKLLKTLPSIHELTLL